jgi:hypothetical protein
MRVAGGAVEVVLENIKQRQLKTNCRTWNALVLVILN